GNGTGRRAEILTQKERQLKRAEVGSPMPDTCPALLSVPVQGHPPWERRTHQWSAARAASRLLPRKAGRNCLGHRRLAPAQPKTERSVGRGSSLAGFASDIAQFQALANTLAPQRPWAPLGDRQGWNQQLTDPPHVLQMLDVIEHLDQVVGVGHGQRIEGRL